MSKKKQSRFTISRKFPEEPGSQVDLNNLEDLLAKLIAQAYAHDHPELFEVNSINPTDQELKDSAVLKVIDDEIQEKKKA